MTNMKETFTDTLMDMLNTQSLDTITVKDIVTRCGVSRQSFYYYFNDIYDIVEWIFTREADRALAEYSDIDNWKTGYVRMMKWSKAHRALVMNTYNSVRREYIEYFMNRVLFQYIIRVVETEAKGINVTQEQCEFIANFYTLALNAISLDWIRRQMKEEPEEIAEKVGILLEGDFKKALINFQKSNL